MREEGDCFILRLNNVDTINASYCKFKWENDGMLKRFFKKTFRRKSKNRKNLVKELMAQFEGKGWLEAVGSETTYEGIVNLEYKVTDASLCHSLSTKLQVQKNLLQVIEGSMQTYSLFILQIIMRAS